MMMMIVTAAAIGCLAGCAGGNKLATTAQIKSDEAKINAAITTFQNDEAAVNQALPAVTGSDVSVP